MDKKRNRFHEITKILLKHGVQKDRSPKNIKETIEELGPTYIKIAQILSTREDIIPKEYCDEFVKLKENAAPLDFDIVLNVINDELGRPGEEVFSSIEKKPLGSASIGQVHKATLLDGTNVVIKVMRPGIYDTVLRDFSMLKKAIKYLDLISDPEFAMSVNTMLDETFETMKQEMDFRNELNNIELFRDNHKEYKYIKLPKTYSELTTSHILVMEYINGIRIDDAERLSEYGYDMQEICAKLVENFVVQIIDHGVFHADPHNGNVMVEDGKIVWLDLGMVGVIGTKDQILYKRAIQAILKDDAYDLKNVLLTMGVCRRAINHAKLYQDIEKLLFNVSNTNIKDLNMGEILEELMSIAQSNGIVLPKGVTMLARSFVIIQNVVGNLDASSNLLTLLGNHVMDRYKDDLDVKKYISSIAQKTVKAANKLTDMPVQIADLLDITLKGQRHLNVEVVNLRENVDKVGRMVNRLILGISLASLILIFGVLASVLIFTVNETWITVIGFICAVMVAITIIFMAILLIVMALKERKK